MASAPPAPGSAEAPVATVRITINGVDLDVPKGELVVESAKRLNIEIPVFCYHPRMKPVGMCRMCLVEVATKAPDGTVRKMPKPQAACTLPVSDGLVIETDTEQIHKDRKQVLEFLLINHPLDCPICDRGGECPLQNNTLFYGPSTSRFVELKRHNKKAFPLSEHVSLDLERCIQCGRCVRFTEEISGDAGLAFRFRGGAMQPGTFELTNFDSKFSGNTIEICPVGALTNRHYRFRARPWDLQTSEAICTVCSNGCNVWFDHRVGKYVRTNGRTNEAINEEWTCDRGKFGHDFYNDPQRLDAVFVRHGDQLRQADWGSAYAQILANFVDAGESAAFLLGQTLSNESLHLAGRFAREFVGTNSIDFRFERYLPTAAETLGTKVGIEEAGISVASLEDAKSFLVFGTSLSDEEPIVFLRARKAWFRNGARIVVAHSEPTDADSFAHLLLHYRPGTEADLAAGLTGAISAEEAETRTGVRAADIAEATTLLSGAPLIATRGLYDAPNGAAAAETLARFAQSTGGRFSLMARGANEQGAHAILGPSTARDTHAILQGCIDGSVKSLWVAGVDLFEVHPDRAFVTRALEAVEFLVVQDLRRTETTDYASVVLPMTAPAETDGTYTNVSGIVQHLAAILKPLGQAKPLWRTMTELMLRLKPQRPFIQARDVYEDLAANNPNFA